MLTLPRTAEDSHNLTRNRYFLMSKIGEIKNIQEITVEQIGFVLQMFLSVFKSWGSSIAGDRTPSSLENEEILFVSSHVHFQFHPCVLVTLSYYLGCVLVSYVTETCQLNYRFMIYGWMNSILNATDTYLLLNF